MNIFKNEKLNYALYGSLFGLCFPVVSYFLLDNPNALFLVICSAPFVLGAVSYLVGAKQDSSNLKIIQSEENLQEFHNILFDQSMDAMMTLEPPSWKFTSGNNACFKLFGVKNAEEFCTLGPWDVSPELQSEDNTSVDLAKINIMQAMERGHSLFDWIHKKLDGTLIYCTVLLSRINIDDKVFLQATVRDMTKEHHEKEQMLHKSKLAHIGEMAAGVGHEINNPLAISSGNVVMIKKELAKDHFELSSIISKIEKIEMGHERIRNIVDGLRTYSRFDKDIKEIIPMRIAIDQTVNLISDIYEKENIKIVRNNPSVDLYTRGSVGELQQIIMNLITNARDATEGQSERNINLFLQNSNDSTLSFSVEDNGHGIPAEIIDKILDPFFTTKEVGKGTGIGLGIVNELIKKMDGNLQIKSEVGKGSTFIMTLPLVTE